MCLFDQQSIDCFNRVLFRDIGLKSNWKNENLKKKLNFKKVALNN